MNSIERLARLERAKEYDDALQTIDRVIRWACVMGRLDNPGAEAMRAEARTIAGNRSAFAAGRWKALEPGLVDLAALEAWWARTWAMVEAWEIRNGIAG